jgi:ethanolamine utilization protein EutN
MKICRVKGSVVSTAKLACYQGLKLMVVQPIDDLGAEVGHSFLAVDRAVQAGEGDIVLVNSEGNGTKQLFKVAKGVDLPIRSVIVGVVDAMDCVPR